ncbi:MAG: glycine cleavage system protein GcvH [Actinobacteria bacterium]|nr:glycine cleavage system protein GcvH [Actinomycetota bacterium]
MGESPNDRRYTSQHEWARADGDRIVVGITDYAQEQLGDVVYVGLPDEGAVIAQGEPMGEVESTKSVSDVYSPVSGTVLEKNADVEGSPELLNSDPYSKGWLVAVKGDASSLEELMTAEEYEEFVSGSDG